MAACAGAGPSDKEELGGGDRVSVLQRQCLNRCIGNIEEYRKEVQSWQDARNNSGEAMDCPFKTENARIKLKHIYPYCKD
ncbi:MAG: hypothetical protein LBT46_01795 [Planctomycetaceae bacterium]|nr:hypothetical protein [Planctomycetaceae bacterium]